MIRRHRFDEKDATVDHGSCSDDGVATKNGGSSIDRHVVLQGRMTLHASLEASTFVLGEAFRAKRDTLISLKVLLLDKLRVSFF